MEIECQLGSDVMMVLITERVLFPCEFEYARKSTAMALRWAARRRTATE